MPANLEIKARLAETGKALIVAHSLPARYAGELKQKDTYFSVENGRLKLREADNSIAELIFYRRVENSDRRRSNFCIYPATDPKSLKAILKGAYGIRGVVEKKRSLFLYNGSRIHIDDVKGLGHFLEFEVPLNRTDGRKKIDFLTEVFNVRKEDYVRESYIDMILSGVRSEKGR